MKATAAPIALHARIHSAAALKAERAPGVAAGHTRFYVEADVVSLIRGRGPLAARISYLVDLPNDARGKAAKLKKKQPVLLFARPVPGAAAGTSSTGSVQLIAPDAQLPWDAATEAQLRAILTELVKPGAPPAIAFASHCATCMSTGCGFKGSRPFAMRSALTASITSAGVGRISCAKGSAKTFLGATRQVIQESSASEKVQSECFRM